MSISPDAEGWYSLERDIHPEIVDQLRLLELVPKLSLSKIPLVTVKLAQRLAGLRVEQLWLQSYVTRRALRHLVQLPGLRILYFLCFKGAGALGNFRKAKTLEVFRATYMTESDILEVTQCMQLRELGAQNAELSARAIAAIMALPNLTSLDLEATCFNDSMAKRISRSRTIQSLDIGATRITRAGLGHMVKMTQLRSIDLWATAFKEADLELLLELPNLEYVSLGNYDHCPQLDSDKVTDLILKLKSLKRVWLDGIHLNASQKEALEAKLESLRHQYADDDTWDDA